MAVLRAYPYGPSGVVGLQVEPRKIAVLEDVRDELVLLLSMGNHGAQFSALLSLVKLSS